MSAARVGVVTLAFAYGLVTAPALRAQEAAGPIVTLRADTPTARLELRGQWLWEDVCGIPCTRAVDPAARYRIAGPSIRASEPFTLTGRSGPVALDVKSASNARHSAGVALNVLGSGLAILGGYALYQSVTYVNTQSSDGTLPDRAVYRGIGGVTLGLGALLLLIGVPLSMSQTRVEVR